MCFDASALYDQPLLLYSIVFANLKLWVKVKKAVSVQCTRFSLIPMKLNRQNLMWFLYTLIKDKTNNPIWRLFSPIMARVQVLKQGTSSTLTTLA